MQRPCLLDVWPLKRVKRKENAYGIDKPIAFHMAEACVPQRLCDDFVLEDTACLLTRDLPQGGGQAMLSG